MTDRRTLQAEGKHPAPCARHCEAKAFEIEIRGLKSALRAALEQPEQEPVAWMFEFPDKRVAPKFDSAPHGGNWVPLYTSLPQCKPLTDEEILLAYQKQWHFHPAEEPNLAKGILQFVRVIEAAHGIGEKL